MPAAVLRRFIVRDRKPFSPSGTFDPVADARCRDMVLMGSGGRMLGQVRKITARSIAEFPKMIAAADVPSRPRRRPVDRAHGDPSTEFSKRR